MFAGSFPLGLHHYRSMLVSAALVAVFKLFKVEKGSKLIVYAPHFFYG